MYIHTQAKKTNLCAPLQTLNITDKLSGYIGYQIVHQISKCVPFWRYITIYGVGYTPFVALSRRENDMLIYVCLDQTKVIAMDCWLHIPVSVPWLCHYTPLLYAWFRIVPSNTVCSTVLHPKKHEDFIINHDLGFMLGFPWIFHSLCLVVSTCNSPPPQLPLVTEFVSRAFAVANTAYEQQGSYHNVCWFGCFLIRFEMVSQVMFVSWFCFWYCFPYSACVVFSTIWVMLGVDLNQSSNIMGHLGAQMCFKIPTKQVQIRTMWLLPYWSVNI